MTMERNTVSEAVTTALTKGPEYQVPKVDEKNIQENLYSKDWDYMEKLYYDLAIMIANSGQSFLELVRLSKSELNDQISPEEHAEIDILSNGFSRDVTNISQDLLKVHKNHKGLQGQPKNDDETFLAITVLENYIALHEKITAVLPTTNARVIEIVGEAYERLTKNTPSEDSLNG